MDYTALLGQQPPGSVLVIDMNGNVRVVPGQAKYVPAVQQTPAVPVQQQQQQQQPQPQPLVPTAGAGTTGDCQLAAPPAGSCLAAPACLCSLPGFGRLQVAATATCIQLAYFNLCLPTMRLPVTPFSLAVWMLAGNPILDLHNSLRARHHAPPLVWSQDLVASAQNWANNLANSCTFYHSGKQHT